MSEQEELDWAEWMSDFIDNWRKEFPGDEWFWAHVKDLRPLQARALRENIERGLRQAYEARCGHPA